MYFYYKKYTICTLFITLLSPSRSYVCHYHYAPILPALANPLRPVMNGRMRKYMGSIDKVEESKFYPGIS